MSKTFEVKITYGLDGRSNVLLSQLEKLPMTNTTITSISIPVEDWDRITYQVDMLLERDNPQLTCGEHKLPEPCQKCSDEVSPELVGRERK